MRMEPKFTAAERAEEYLQRIAALTGAQQDDDGAYLLRATIPISPPTDRAGRFRCRGVRGHGM